MKVAITTWIECNVTGCKHNKDGDCKAGMVTIAEQTCMTYEAKKE